jgi:parallel beta-helix repeat protein
MLIPMTIMLWAAPALAMHLQDAYDQAGPGEGYDKLVLLNPSEVYTGFMNVAMQTSCRLRGNGALIVLAPGGQIWAGSTSKLDVEGCVITGGACGLSYDYTARSTVQNCTISNCIVVGNFEYGVACREGSEPTMVYNDVWGNGALDYAAFCPT